MNHLNLSTLCPASICAAIIAVCLPSTSRAETSQGSSGPNPIYRSSANLDISVGNNGADDFYCSWSAGVGMSPSNVPDPHIVIEVGYYITFSRTSAGHPLWVMSGNMPVAMGKDRKLYRTVTEQATLDTYKLANGNMLPHGSLQENGTSMGGNPIFWQPTVGTYYYTCGVPGHNMMVGRIDVVPAMSINHSVYPQPYLQMDGKRVIKSRKNSFYISGLTSGKAVSYSYKDGKKRVRKTMEVPSDGLWRRKIALRRSTTKASIVIYSTFETARSSNSTIRYTKLVKKKPKG